MCLSSDLPTQRGNCNDDASTDRTQEVVKKYPVIYHRNERNMERAYSRNKGVELSKGELIFFLDHDDLWREDYIESVLEHLEDSQIVYSFPRSFINSEGSLLRVSRKKLPEDPLELVFSGMVGYSRPQPSKGLPFWAIRTNT
jgi:glycosyltransferase involved in cell wall biosynthesis